MIVARLMGGLGNQMFQYAAARSLAIRHGTDVKLDISHLCHPEAKREYALGAFQIAATVAEPDEFRKVETTQNSGLKKLVNLAMGRPSLAVVNEKSFVFDPAFLTMPDNCYLIGYWQSERYFAEAGATIRQDFQPSQLIADNAVSRAIKNSNAISIHVRRGDYVSNSIAAEVLGTLSQDYYAAAFTLMKKSVSNPHFFVFSDDIAWCRANLRFEGETSFVEEPSQAAAQLQLMSQCKHHIIANSSFSWWGAWLNASPEKIVIAPKKWFNSPDYDARDLVPERWVRV